MEPPVALSIAGSDSGGAAGIQADIKTMTSLRVHATTVLTAVTAQNTQGVRAVQVVTPDVVRAQIEAVLEDYFVAAAKTGMLATPDIIEVVTSFASRQVFGPLVVDPVLLATSGASLMSGSPQQHYFNLSAHAHLLTPNIPEAATLLGRDVAQLTSLAHQRDWATDLSQRAGCAVLLKGGHLNDELVTDVLADAHGVDEFVGARVTTNNDHGTGCTLSAAITAALARGHTVRESVALAHEYVKAALHGASSWRIGHGRGGLNHMGAQ